MPDLTRRGFMAVTGALGAVAAANPLKKYINKLVSYVQPPPLSPPGEWTPFATTCRECPAGCGMYQMHRDGRVTKAEGNPSHPVNRGALCARGQSSLQGLYDPDRVKGPLRRDRRTGLYTRVSWEGVHRELGQLLNQGGRVGIVSRLETGTLLETLRQFAASFASDRVLLYEPYALEPLRTAHQMLYGMPVIPDYRLEKSGHIIGFGADFLETWASPVQFAARFSQMHAFTDSKAGRFSYVGPRLSMTGANADDFLAVPPGREAWVALALLRSLTEQGLVRNPQIGAQAASLATGDAAALSGVPKETINAIARSFAERDGVALAAPAGATGAAPLATAVLAGLLNEAVGAVGTRVDFSRPHALSSTATEEQLERFLDGITNRDLVLINQTNIAFTRPSARERLRRAAAVIYLGTLPDETAEIADWILPVDSPLESWGDYQPYPGLHGLQQPTMARLWDTRGAGEILVDLARVAGHPVPGFGAGSGGDNWNTQLKSRWETIQGRAAPGTSFDTFFTQALQNGFVEERVAALRPALRQVAGPLLTAPPARQPSLVQLWLWPSIMFYDGRTANRGWIQEAPDPVSYASWSSWIDLHPDTALRFGVADGELVELTHDGSRLQAPVRVTTEIAEGVAGMTLGQGHTSRGLKVACGMGSNGFVLLDPRYTGQDNFPAVTLRGTGKPAPAIYSSPTKEQQSRELLKWSKLSQLRHQQPAEAEEIVMPTPEGYQPAKDLYAAHQHRLHRWAMVIDLQKCIGCGACAVACYAENNIPVVGRKKFSQGREMAWLKVVPYRHPEQKGRIGWLPLPCQHCDAAPCEPVCPVYAAVHNEEGLNAQIYNRCIGTRYCSNNCPYKVRRFNWFDYSWRKPLEQQLNPEVTVRCRGVMEKCTFCVQRIRKAEYTAIQENRPLAEGEVVPACMQTCPAGVFSFGDLQDPKSELARKFSSEPRRYQLLKELNTKSAVLYLKKVEQDV